MIVAGFLLALLLFLLGLFQLLLVGRLVGGGLVHLLLRLLCELIVVAHQRLSLCRPCSVDIDRRLRDILLEIGDLLCEYLTARTDSRHRRLIAGCRLRLAAIALERLVDEIDRAKREFQDAGILGADGRCLQMEKEAG